MNNHENSKIADKPGEVVEKSFHPHDGHGFPNLLFLFSKHACYDSEVNNEEGQHDENLYRVAKLFKHRVVDIGFLVNRTNSVFNVDSVVPELFLKD